MLCYRGVDNTTPLDGATPSATSDGSAVTTVTTGTVTPSGSTSWLLALLSQDAVSTYHPYTASSPAGLNERFDDEETTGHCGGAAYDVASSGSGAQSVTATIGSSEVNNKFLLALRAARRRRSSIRTRTVPQRRRLRDDGDVAAGGEHAGRGCAEHAVPAAVRVRGDGGWESSEPDIPLAVPKQAERRLVRISGRPSLTASDDQPIVGLARTSLTEPLRRARYGEARRTSRQGKFSSLFHDAVVDYADVLLSPSIEYCLTLIVGQRCCSWRHLRVPADALPASVRHLHEHAEPDGAVSGKGIVADTRSRPT